VDLVQVDRLDAEPADASFYLTQDRIALQVMHDPAPGPSASDAFVNTYGR
jgi:hypothetical protein